MIYALFLLLFCLGVHIGLICANWFYYELVKEETNWIDLFISVFCWFLVASIIHSIR